MQLTAILALGFAALTLSFPTEANAGVDALVAYDSFPAAAADSTDLPEDTESLSTDLDPTPAQFTAVNLSSREDSVDRVTHGAGASDALAPQACGGPMGPEAANMAGKHHIGGAFFNKREVDDLWETGGCQNYKSPINGAAWCLGFRCRFYESRLCRDQIGPDSGSNSNLASYQDLPRTARSGTCWWSPSDEVLIQKRDLTIGGVIWESINQASGTLVASGECHNFDRVANKGSWLQGYTCSFYEARDCKWEIGGYEGLAGKGRGNIVSIDKESYSASCWLTPRSLHGGEENALGADTLAIESGEVASEH